MKSATTPTGTFTSYGQGLQPGWRWNLIEKLKLIPTEIRPGVGKFVLSESELDKINELIEASNRQDRVIAQLARSLSWKALSNEDDLYYRALRDG